MQDLTSIMCTDENAVEFCCLDLDEPSIKCPSRSTAELPRLHTTNLPQGPIKSLDC